MKKLASYLAVFSMSIFAMGTIGCDNGDLDEAGQQIEEGVQDAGEATEGAFEDAGEQTEEAFNENE